MSTVVPDLCNNTNTSDLHLSGNNYKMYHAGNYFMCDCCLFCSDPLTYNCLSQIENERKADFRSVLFKKQWSCLSLNLSCRNCFPIHLDQWIGGCWGEVLIPVALFMISFSAPRESPRTGRVWGPTATSGSPGSAGSPCAGTCPESLCPASPSDLLAHVGTAVCAGWSCTWLSSVAVTLCYTKPQASPALPKLLCSAEMEFFSFSFNERQKGSSSVNCFKHCIYIRIGAD